MSQGAGLNFRLWSRLGFRVININDAETFGSLSQFWMLGLIDLQRSWTRPIHGYCNIIVFLGSHVERGELHSFIKLK